MVSRLITAEAKKILYLKWSRICLLVTVLASPAFGLLLSLTTRMTTGRAFVDLLPREVLSMNLLGVDLANIMLIVFTAMSISREFSTKSIQVSLALTPTRTHLLTARLATVFGLSLVFSLITVSAAYLVSQMLLVAHQMPLLGLTDVGIARMLVGVMVMPVFYCVLTAAAAFAFWSGAGAVTFSLCVLAVQALVGLFPEDIQTWLMPFTPQSAVHNLAGMNPPDSWESVSLVVSAAVLVMWATATILVASWRLQRKDV